MMRRDVEMAMATEVGIGLGVWMGYDNSFGEVKGK